MALAAAAGLAHAAVRAEPVHVHPAAGSPATTFTVSYVLPDATGVSGSLRHRDIVSAALAAGSRAGCTAATSSSAPDAAAGTVVHVALSPPRGGAFCRGRWQGTVTEEGTPVCKPGRACPQFIVLLGVIGRFSFTVRAP
jgi:hypothetical protein